MLRSLPDGVWPTMLTPFRPDGGIDLDALESLTAWYIDHGAAGLFAVCQSSEMFFLSLEEKIKLARATVKAAAGRVPVICSGHTADNDEQQIEELRRMAETGVDVLVLVTNRLVGPQDGDELLIENIDRILDALPPQTSFGLYECPYPFKRLLSSKVLRHCADDGRFVCLKDTCCSESRIRERLQLLSGSPLKLYNANAATLLQSLRDGAAGYCGVMANFFPDAYRDLTESARSNPARSQLLQNWMGPLSLLEKGGYPLNAKLYLQKAGVIPDAFTRSLGTGRLETYLQRILEQAARLVESIPSYSKEDSL